MNDLTGERRSPRIPCNLPLEYEISGLGIRDGLITNLGTGGALLAIQEPVPLGAELVLHFRLPVSNRPIRKACTVKSAEGPSVGVEFAHLDFHEKDEIWKFYARESARKRRPRS
ncbi:MAG: PilZ domain-containing protein [Candidatus Methylomirabilales bacterium]